MHTYMICLVGLQLRQAVVIGGGAVAAQKIQGLLPTEVKVTVISPALNSELQMLVEQGKLTHIAREYQNGDLDGAYLVIAATDDPEVNHAVWAEAQARGCLINVVDDPEHCTFISPAMVRRGDLNIAISTGGGSPALARWMRMRLEAIIGVEYSLLAEIMGELRHEINQGFPPGKARLAAAMRVLNSDILTVIREDGKDAALAYARRQIDPKE